MYEKSHLRELEKLFAVNLSEGLTQREAEDRRRIHGENTLAQPPARTFLGMFGDQLNDPLIYVLFAAAAVSMFLREFSDAMIILVVIVMNAVVGVIQEGKAQKALDALKKMTSPTAMVKREGVYREIQAAMLVPGDIVSLEAGCQVPADLRLIHSSSLKAEESALTGESVPVEKDSRFLAVADLPIGDRKNMVYMSTSIVYGRGEGIVTAAGMNTEIGKIADLINDTKQEATPLQRRLGELGKYLSIGALILCLLLFFIAILQKRNIFQMLITAISLAVAAVPEGLPAVVTIVLALSVSRMVRVNTIVRRLPAVETLGSVNVVCSDKTGTLTQNRMKVMQCYTSRTTFPAERLDVSKHRILVEGFALCNDAFREGDEIFGDPTEVALIEMAADCGMDKRRLEATQIRIDEIPFDSDRKMMTTLHRDGSRQISYTKGSCDELLKKCTRILIGGSSVPLSAADKREITQAMERMSMQALRVLGLAMREHADRVREDELTFVGLVGMTDPPREEAKEAIALFKKAGVKTVMITGDHVDTAFAVARQLDIAVREEECVTGEQLDRMSEERLNERIGRLSVFARVSPQHKVRIVKAFKNQGNIVAMTGDGVNDAPSLQAADIGISMGKNGTDVAKNASDIILTDDNFATIERAIEEGRGIYENIKKSVIFLLSSNLGEIITMFLAVTAGFSSPLKASHILWINLITDSLPALALGVDENDRRLLMSRPPRGAHESLFADGGMFYTLFYGILIAGVSLAAFMTLPFACLAANNMQLTLENFKSVLENPEILTRAQTYAFTVLGMSELFHAVGMRDVRKSFFRTNPLTNRLMIAAFFIGLALQVGVTEIPFLVNIFETVRLSIREWLQLAFLAALPLLAHEILLLRPERLMHRAAPRPRGGISASTET